MLFIFLPFSACTSASACLVPKKIPPFQGSSIAALKAVRIISLNVLICACGFLSDSRHGLNSPLPVGSRSPFPSSSTGAVFGLHAPLTVGVTVFSAGSASPYALFSFAFVWGSFFCFVLFFFTSSPNSATYRFSSLCQVFVSVLCPYFVGLMALPFVFPFRPLPFLTYWRSICGFGVSLMTHFLM